ncbi:MAG: TonB C-terminal domain-containing protein [Bdellovibrionaceae bacterium]|nr:TonB C-terminal domain-containing protein [Pseudobdellovibrionaceae bacterium]
MHDPKSSALNSPRPPRSNESLVRLGRVVLAILASVLLHLGFSWLSWTLLDQATPARPTTMIEWIEPSAIDKKDWITPENQIVRKTEVAKDVITAKSPVNRRFLSEDEQTVLKETKAAASGMTENRRGLNPSEQPDLTSRPRRRGALQVKPESPLAGAAGDIAFGLDKTKSEKEEELGDSRELALPFDPRQTGMSTNGEQLPPDIEIGNFTALNTDRFRYYSFYSRIEEQIRHRWVKYVKATLYSGRFPPSARSFTTKIEIVLDRQGDFVRAIIHNESGSQSIDAAPVLAFREAKRIPHPPREMVKEDGTVRLFYAFHVDQIPGGSRSARRSADADDSDTQ